jgi:hypothetical protein
MPNKTLWLTPEMRKEICVMVKAEVTSQMAPVLTDLSAVKAQNTEQSRTLTSTQQNVQSIDDWKNALWGNGSGKEGFLDKARKEDKVRLDSMEEGFAKMQNHLDVEKVVATRVAEALTKEGTKRDKQFNRIIVVLGILATLFGGGLLDHLLSASHVIGH